MKQYTNGELEIILKNHKLWLADAPGGVRANLSRADLYGSDLSGADLYGANLSRANLYGSDLSGADLYGAELSGADLYGANLSRANLPGANLYGANLSGANLSGADLSYANLSGANLSGANLFRANLSETILYGKKIVTFTFGQHLASYTGLDEITIGCHKHSLQHWLTTFEEIGRANKYTDEQIEAYGNFIKSCVRDFNKGVK